ncbi:hypothetical protein X732_04565 [Mesorhizobium sp. L2C066B000]|nr:hypothetical protein X732_04565 [Mesorhizobium sp. L2C066B000]
MNISDRLGEAPERERLPPTSKSLAEELALIHIPGWRVESAIDSVEYSRWGERRQKWILHSTMPFG